MAKEKGGNKFASDDQSDQKTMLKKKGISIVPARDK